MKWKMSQMNRGAVSSRVAYLLMLIAVTLPVCASAGDAKPSTFDQFIDSASGTDVQHEGEFSNNAYRAKRVNKYLWTFIDRRGYYIVYRKKFNEWCESSGGQAQISNDDMTGLCVDKNDSGKVLGAYEVQLTTTASYDGQMTAGFATFYYFDQNGYARKAATENAASQAQNEAMQRNQQCLQALTREIQQNPQPGMETNAGMIVSVNLPLAQVQNHAYPPVTQWVRVSVLSPVPQKNYCGANDPSNLN